MQELIKVENKNGELLVSARQLHEGLGIGKDFSTWIKDMMKYGFEENVDYVVFTDFGEKGGRPRKEYVLKIDMAKEIAMIQRSEKGKQVRRYFIECEKKLKEVILPSYQIQDPIERAKAWIKEHEERKMLAQTIEEQKPKVEYHDTVLNCEKLVTTTDIAKDLGMSARALNLELNKLGVIYKQGKTWKLYAKYQNKVPEYCDYHINEFGQTLKWTEKGRKFIIELLEK